MDKDLYKTLKTILTDAKLLIFDMDGVIVDVFASYRTTIKKTAEHFCKQKIEYTLIQELKNKGGFNNDWDLTCELLNEKNIKVPRDEVINVFQDIYWGKNGEGLIQKEKWLIDNTTMQKLNNNYKLAIFTGRPRKEALFTLEKNKAISYFFPIIAMENVDKQKPNPEGINAILKQMKLPKTNTIYFGDTIDDIIAASKSGVHSIAISKLLDRTLTDAGALGIIDNINEIAKLI